MKRKQLWIIVGIELVVLLVFLIFHPSIPCFFKKVFLIPCPGCGMTRAFYAFLQGHFWEAFTNNILFYPVVLFLGFLPIRLLFAIRRGEKTISFSFFRKKSVLWIIGFLLLCSEVYNLIHGI